MSITFVWPYIEPTNMNIVERIDISVFFLLSIKKGMSNQ